MYYVSGIEEYPIYEPAEGGYYYAGEQVTFCRPCSTWKKAKRIYNKLKREFENDNQYWPVFSYETGGCGKDGMGSFIRTLSRYVGDNTRIQITNYRPEDKGWHPYC